MDISFSWFVWGPILRSRLSFRWWLSRGSSRPGTREEEVVTHHPGRLLSSSRSRILDPRRLDRSEGAQIYLQIPESPTKWMYRKLGCWGLFSAMARPFGTSVVRVIPENGNSTSFEASEPWVQYMPSLAGGVAEGSIGALVSIRVKMIHERATSERRAALSLFWGGGAGPGRTRVRCCGVDGRTVYPATPCVPWYHP